MDLEEWEVLPDDGFLEINDDGGKKIFSRKYKTDDDSLFNMNYFICPDCPPSNSSQFVESTKPSWPTIPKHVVPLPTGINTIESVSVEPAEPQGQQVSQVFFKKMSEAELSADMKMDAPRSSSKAFVPQIDVGEAYKVEPSEGTKNIVSSPRRVEGIQENEGFNLWNWSLTGIGAICSFGVAAATTICIIFIGNHQKHRRQEQSHKIRFQIYADDKRIKKVVHHASKLNEAISTVRGVPFTRAHITVGGYCDAF